jgi:hypothetical protein
MMHPRVARPSVSPRTARPGQTLRRATSAETGHATTQTICWAVVFFFASAGASAGYLTASEVFPLEVRAQSIAVFFAIAQLFGAFGSHWYGHLIGDGSNRNTLFAGYIVGAGAMILGGVAAIFFGVAAEGQVAGGRRDAALGRRETTRDHLPLWRRPRGHRPGRAITPGGYGGREAPIWEGLELQEMVEALVGRVLLSEVRGLRALHRQVGRRAQRAER